MNTTTRNRLSTLAGALTIGGLLTAIVLLLVLSTGCTFDPQIRSDKPSPTAPPPVPEPEPDPDPITITAAGAVSVSGLLIGYVDRSTTNPPGECREIHWQVRTSETNVVSSRIDACGGGGNFGPLGAGIYVVDQLAVANDGATAQKSYGPFGVGGF